MFPRVISYFLAHRHLAAARLALALFEHEQGRPAHSLEDLVPDYLPAVPSDPMDLAGGPIRAILEDGELQLHFFDWEYEDQGEIAVERNPAEAKFSHPLGPPPEKVSQDPLSP
jgi:hypothetical protein